MNAKVVGETLVLGGEVLGKTTKKEGVVIKEPLI